MGLTSTYKFMSEADLSPQTMQGLAITSHDCAIVRFIALWLCHRGIGRPWIFMSDVLTVVPFFRAAVVAFDASFLNRV